MRPILLLGLLAACTPAVEPGPCDLQGAAPLIDDRRANPFPSAWLEAPADGGCQLALRADDLPLDGAPFPVEAVNDRDGFSPVGTIVVFPGAALDDSVLPGVDAGARSVSDAPIELWDLDAGVRLPYFAELDAWPTQPDSERALLIRPLKPLPFGAWIGVALGALPTVDGGNWARPARFEEALAGEGDAAAHLGRVVDRLAELGTAADGLTLAWDFHVATEASLRRSFDAVVDGVLAAVPAGGAAPPVQITRLRVAGEAEQPAPGLWREARLPLTLPGYLWEEDGSAPSDEGVFRREAGVPQPSGDAPVYVTAVVPESLRGAAAGSACALVFGHGIFGAPQGYLADGSDGARVIDLLNRLGCVGVGSEWRGLTQRDRPDSVRVATDPGRFPLITDKLVQGVADQIALARALRTDFIDEDFLAAEGGGSLVDPDQIVYFGISLGGIEGATLAANSDDVRAAALHVPGGVWATMLERSSNWNAFEAFVSEAIRSPQDRQLLYAMSALLWDPVDPATHVHRLAGKDVLWQVSRHDEQVPTFTAEVVARAAGASLGAPPVWPVWGLPEATLPQQGGLVLFQYDGGFDPPPTGNRPAQDSGAHDGIRRTDEVQGQLEAFLAGATRGRIVHPCAPASCVIDPAR